MALRFISLERRPPMAEQSNVAKATSLNSTLPTIPLVR